MLSRVWASRREIAVAAAAGVGAWAAYDVATAPAAEAGLTVVADGLLFPEGPRWRSADGRLYFSDMHQHKVLALETDGEHMGTLHEVAATDGPGNACSGLGWLPDGRLLVVLMEPRAVAVLDGGHLRPYADLSGVECFRSNDMCVDGAGRAYVGGFGFDIASARNPFGGPTTRLALCAAGSGAAAAAGGDVRFPNGCVITPDGRTLIVAETFGLRLAAFDRDPSTGALSRQRVWAELPGLLPDGICLDAEGCVWAAIPAALPRNAVRGPFSTLLAYIRARRIVGGFVRVKEGGQILDQILLPNHMGIACMLGGADGRTLFMLCAETSDEKQLLARGKGNGLIATKRVAVGAAKDPSNPNYNGGYC